MLAFGKQRVVVCKAQAVKLQMLKTKFSGLNSNIIYKAQISLFTHVTWREMLLNDLLLLLLLVMLWLLLCYKSTFVSICLGCLLLLFGACSSTELNVSLIGLWLQDANRPLKRWVPSPLLLVGVCSTGCESLLVLVSLFVVVLFFSKVC